MFKALTIWFAILLGIYGSGNYRLIPFLTIPPLLYVGYYYQDTALLEWQPRLVFILIGVFAWFAVEKLFLPWWLLRQVQILRRTADGDAILKRKDRISNTHDSKEGFPVSFVISNRLPSTLKNVGLSIHFGEKVGKVFTSDLHWETHVTAQGTIFSLKERIGSLPNGSDHALGQLRVIFPTAKSYQAQYLLTADNFNALNCPFTIASTEPPV